MKSLFRIILIISVLMLSVSCSKEYYVEKYGNDADETALFEFLEGEWEIESYYAWGYEEYIDSNGIKNRIDETGEDNGPVSKSSDNYFVLKFDRGIGTVLATGDPELQWLIGVPTPYYVYGENKLEYPLFYGDVAEHVTVTMLGDNYMQVVLDDVGYAIDCDEHDGFFVNHKASCKDYRWYLDLHYRLTFRRVRKVIVATPPEGWMTYVPDATPLSEVSIPGTHASASFYGLSDNSTYVTQRAKIEDQWASGVRAFDLTVSEDGSLSFKGNALKKSFRDVVEILQEQLKTYMQETALVFVNVPEGMNESEKQSWRDYIGDVVSDLGNIAGVWRPDMTMRDARGRIIFVMDENYTWRTSNGEKPGARIQRSGDKAQFTSMAGGNSETVYIQDDKDMTAAEKLNAVFESMEFSMKFDDADYKDNSWMINSLSTGDSNYALYAADIMAGVFLYLNGAEVHKTLTGELLGHAWKKTKTGPLGIVFMDFAATDDSFKGEVSGSMLVEAIYRNNFR